MPGKHRGGNKPVNTRKSGMEKAATNVTKSGSKKAGQTASAGGKRGGKQKR